MRHVQLPAQGSRRLFCVKAPPDEEVFKAEPAGTMRTRDVGGSPRRKAEIVQRGEPYVDDLEVLQFLTEAHSWTCQAQLLFML